MLHEVIALKRSFGDYSPEQAASNQNAIQQTEDDLSLFAALTLKGVMTRLMLAPNACTEEAEGIHAAEIIQQSRRKDWQTAYGIAGSASHASKPPGAR